MELVLKYFLLVNNFFEKLDSGALINKLLTLLYRLCYFNCLYFISSILSLNVVRKLNNPDAKSLAVPAVNKFFLLISFIFIPNILLMIEEIILNQFD